MIVCQIRGLPRQCVTAFVKTKSLNVELQTILSVYIKSGNYVIVKNLKKEIKFTENYNLFFFISTVYI